MCVCVSECIVYVCVCESAWVSACVRRVLRVHVACLEAKERALCSTVIKKAVYFKRTRWSDGKSVLANSLIRQAILMRQNHSGAVFMTAG